MRPRGRRQFLVENTRRLHYSAESGALSLSMMTHARGGIRPHGSVGPFPWPHAFPRLASVNTTPPRHLRQRRRGKAQDEATRSSTLSRVARNRWAREIELHSRSYRYCSSLMNPPAGDPCMKHQALGQGLSGSLPCCCMACGAMVNVYLTASDGWSVTS